MVLFGFILVVSVAALWAVQKMDIECVNPPRPKRRAEIDVSGGGDGAAADLGFWWMALALAALTGLDK
jgi:hypothetical protein